MAAHPSPNHRPEQQNLPTATAVSSLCGVNVVCGPRSGIGAPPCHAPHRRALISPAGAPD